MLQRIHLSGALLELSDEAFATVCEGVAVYKELRNEIPRALPFYPLGLPDYNADWLCLGLQSEERTLLAVWRRGGEQSERMLPVQGAPKVLYPSNTKGSVAKVGEGVRVTLPTPYSAMILALE